jgi:ribosomal protein S18 acetylase RimI-like enzyme
VIRDYDAARDAVALRACFVELQETERAFDPRAPRGEAIADAYLARMFERCAKWAGHVFVAEADGGVVGFACVWGRVPPQEVDDDPADAAYVSDLVVLPAWRGRGLGRALLARVEAYAREQGVASIGIGVMHPNRDARRLYERLGYAAVHVELVKRLS